jgi:Skp family chaperone for outer membrane proteins
MKKVFFFLLVSVGLMFSQAYAKDIKIGVINPATMLTSYEKAKDYDKALEGSKEQKAKDYNLDAKKDEIMKMRDKMGLLKDKEQADMKDKITKALNDYRDLEEKATSELQKDSETKMKEVIDDVEKAIKAYATANGYDLVLDKGVVLYGGEGNDITDAITKSLNDKYKSSKGSSSVPSTKK